MATSPTDVALVCMPFGSLYSPLAAVSVLRGSLERLGMSSRTFYLSFRLARMIGAKRYVELSDPTLPIHHHAIGEWLFAGEVFERSEADVARYFDEVLERPSLEYRPFVNPLPPRLVRTVERVLGKVGGFLEACLDEVAACAPQVVGFSCVFEQRLASLALAKRIKERAPETTIVLGGPTCEGVQAPELIRRFPYVDVVVSGEGDEAFPEVVRRVLDGTPLSGMQGVYAQGLPLPEPTNGHCPNTPLVQDLDGLPWLHYDEFLEQYAASNLQLDRGVSLYMEASRGCWWGAKSRCLFCSFGGADMAYRSKSSHRALKELRYMAAKYPGLPLTLTDNILNTDYFDDFIPALAAEPLGTDLACDIKANLSKDQIRALRDANVMFIQPGVESLSTAVLRRMRKGITAIRNVQLLKWCKELGVQSDWNFLWGFPGESADDYARMAELIPRLTHLPPPDFVGRINVGRFSPCFEEAEQLGITNIRPSPAYAHVYPFDPDTVANLATYFTYTYRPGQDPDEYTQAVADAIRAWKAHRHTSELFALQRDDGLWIWDQRPGAVESLTVLTGLVRDLYLACDGVRRPESLSGILGRAGAAATTSADVERCLQPLVDQGLMMRDGNRYLSLAIPVGEYRPGTRAWRRFVAQMERERQLTRLEGIRGRVRFTDNTARARVGPAEVVRALRSRRS